MKGICFKEPLHHDTVNGKKTQIRRIITPQKNITKEFIGFSRLVPKGYIEIRGYHENGEYGSSFFKPKYKVGEVVYLKEPFVETNNGYAYKYGDNNTIFPIDKEKIKWKNKLSMPAKAARNFIKITSVRAERLQSISEEDCINEGIRYIDDLGCFYFDDLNKKDEGYYFNDSRSAFTSLIDKISGKGTWERNPFVWRIEFEIITEKY